MSLLNKIPRFQFFRGNTPKNNNYQGRHGELSLDMDAGTVRLHNGSDKGGHVVGQSKVEKYSGSNITLDFRTYMAYEVSLSGNATIDFTGRQPDILNEMLVNIKGLNNTAVVWPSGLRWMRPDGTFVANPANMGFEFTNNDWMVFWTHTASGTIQAKIMR